jgi:UDP-2,3-diacylglucosamine pyrophosphatase LpxH
MNQPLHRPPGRADLRTIWISDLHIGTRESKVDLLVDFLTHNSCETLYLVGDIVDLRVISQKQRWLRDQEKALQTLMGLAQSTRVIVLPGNHDRVLRHFPPLQGGNIFFEHDHVHTTVDGRRLLVTHGDAMDQHIRTDISGWYLNIACFLYYAALAFEHRINIRRLKRGRALKRYLGAIKVSLSSWRAYRDKFIAAIVAGTDAAGMDGVVCGHIHAPCLEQRGRVLYANTGDWVENCTALVETHEGALKLVRWDRFDLEPAGTTVTAITT